MKMNMFTAVVSGLIVCATVSSGRGCEPRTVSDFTFDPRGGTYPTPSPNSTQFSSEDGVIRVDLFLPGQQLVTLQSLQVVSDNVEVFKARFFGLNDTHIVRYDGPADGEQLTVKVSAMEVSKLTVIAFRPSSSNDTFSLAVDQLIGCVLAVPTADALPKTTPTSLPVQTRPASGDSSSTPSPTTAGNSTASPSPAADATAPATNATGTTAVASSASVSLTPKTTATTTSSAAPTPSHSAWASTAPATTPSVPTAPNPNSTHTVTAGASNSAVGTSRRGLPTATAGAPAAGPERTNATAAVDAASASSTPSAANTSESAPSSTDSALAESNVTIASTQAGTTRGKDVADGSNTTTELQTPPPFRRESTPSRGVFPMNATSAGDADAERTSGGASVRQSVTSASGSVSMRTTERGGFGGEASPAKMNPGSTDYTDDLGIQVIAGSIAAVIEVVLTTALLYWQRNRICKGRVRRPRVATVFQV